MKYLLKVDRDGYLIYGNDLYFEEGNNDIPDGYVETPLPTDGSGKQLPFYKPKWTGSEWVEGKTLEEFEEEAFMESLKPNADEVAKAEFEIKTLNILMEVELL